MSYTNAVGARQSNTNAPLHAARLLVAAAGLAAGTGWASGANISWVGPSGNWNAGANWSTGNVPGMADNVTLDKAGTIITLDDADYTVRSLKINSPTTALHVNARKLTVPSAVGIVSGVTQGSLRLNASNVGVARLDFTGDFDVGNGGKIVMDAPATAGESSLLGTLVRTLSFGTGSELTVSKGAGGKRSIFGNVRNAGVWKIDHDLTVDITVGLNGNFTGTFENNGGDLRVNAGANFNVKGDNIDSCNFIFKSNGLAGAAQNRLLTGKGTAFENLTFDFQGGLVRNAADNGRGGVVAKDSRLKLTSTNDIFVVVEGANSRIATGVKGAQQELYVKAPNLKYEGNVKFENRGKISLVADGVAATTDFDSNNQQFENTGTVQTLGGGKVTIKGQVINKKNISIQTPTKFDRANSVHVNDIGANLTMDVQGALLEINNTMSNFGTIGLGAGVNGATIKGVAPVTNRMRNKATGTIDKRIKNQGNLRPEAAPGFSITDPAVRVGGLDASVVSTLTIDMGLDCEPGSAIQGNIIGLSPLSFESSCLEVINGGLDLGSSSYHLFLEGFEPAPGQVFPVVRSDSFITGAFDFGNGVSDLLYPIGGSGSLQFRVAYNVPDTSSPGMYLVTLTAEAVPTPGTVSLLAVAGLLAGRRRR